MKSLAVCLGLLLFVFLPTSVHAGPWISSGGDQLGDAHNPWFLENTPLVRYCISVDNQSASVSASEVRAAFQKSVDFWSQEFSNNQWTQGKNALPLVIPKFIEQPCDGQEELAILIGTGSLNRQQKAFIETAELEAVAVAVRTDYDRINLRGRGFFYIAGDKKKPDWIPNAWTKSNRLTSVLAHEVGHVMGVPHQQGDFAAMIDSGNNQAHFPIALNLMSENFPQAMVLEANNFAVSLAVGIVPIFTGTHEHHFCDLPEETRTWLALSSEISCIKLVLSSLVLDSDVFASIYAVGNKTVLLGTLKAGPNNPLLSSRFDVITQVYLTPEQQVFQNQMKLNKFVVGGSQVFASLQLSYFPAYNQKSKPVLIDVSPAHITMMGIQNQSFIKVLSQKLLRPLLK